MTESRARLLAAAGLAAVTVAWLALLFPQVRWPVPFLNDSVLHFGLIQALASAPARGQSLLDPWVPTWTMGFPVFHYYQSLPHFAVVALDAVTPLSLVRTFKAVEWLAVGTLPVPVFLAMRWLGFGRMAALIAAGLILGIRTDYLHGLDLESYTWQGLGQYSQAFGGWFLPLGIAATWRATREGRGLFPATLLMTVTFLSHLALGYMGFMAAGIGVLIGPARELPRRIGRLAIVAGVTGFAILAVAVPIIRDFAWYNVSTLVPSWKYNSFGHEVVLPWLFRGELFDHGRAPVLTVLTLAGVLVVALRAAVALAGAIAAARGRALPDRVAAVRPSASRRDAELFLLAGFVYFLLLFFGRPTWGSLLNLLPLGSGFHYSRAIYLVHQLGAMIAGVAIAAVIGGLGRLLRVGIGAAGFRFPVGAALGASALLIALVPVATDRASYLLDNGRLVREAAAAYAKEGPALERALATAREDRLGRAYAGQGAPGVEWGGAFMVGWAPVYSWFPQREMDALGYLYHMWSLNADMHDSFDERNPVHYRAFGVRRVIAPAGRPVPPFFAPIASEGRFAVYAVDNPGLVDLVDVPYRLDVSKRNVTRLHRRWLRGDQPAKGLAPEIRLDEAGGPEDGAGIDANGYDFRLPPARPWEGAPGEILAAERTGEDFRIRVRADRATHVLLRVTYHPLWRATVDGQPVRPLHVMPSYLAVPVAAGEHEVQLAYRPGRSRAVLVVLGGVALLGLAGAERRRRRGTITPPA
jgi:hypothetical protein